MTDFQLRFALLTKDERIERIRRLFREGWTERELICLTGWRADYLRRALAERTSAPERRTT